MFRYILAGFLLGAAHGMTVPAWADPIKENEFFTPHAQGCMLLQECTDHVKEIRTVSDLNKDDYLSDVDYDVIADEFNALVRALNKVGSKVYLADSRYFPIGHRGVYHTVSNNFFLNVDFMKRPNTVMSVMRHEGWHAAQDCMAGTIKNNLIAIIKPEEDVPMIWREMAERTYPSEAVPWEAEAGWAGRTEGMTAKALKACADGNMWEVYEPTPLTEKWLKENNYIK